MVVGSRGPRPFSKPLRGSVSAELLHRSRVPVVVVP
ncbi:MAG: universal stress protein [Thermoplasmata archaeon]